MIRWCWLAQAKFLAYEQNDYNLRGMRQFLAQLLRCLGRRGQLMCVFLRSMVEGMSGDGDPF